MSDNVSSTVGHDCAQRASFLKLALTCSTPRVPARGCTLRWSMVNAAGSRHAGTSQRSNAQALVISGRQRALPASSTRCASTICTSSNTKRPATTSQLRQCVVRTGARGWRAAQLAGLAAVPVVVKEATPRAMLELALVENVVRADLSPLEEAAAYRQLIDEFGLTQSAVAERVGGVGPWAD